MPAEIPIHLGEPQPRRRVIAVSLPYIEQIADEAHYSRPWSTWRQIQERATGPEPQHIVAAVDPRRDAALGGRRRTSRSGAWPRMTRTRMQRAFKDYEIAEKERWRISVRREL